MLSDNELRERGERRMLVALKALLAGRSDFIAIGDSEATQRGGRAAMGLKRALSQLDVASDELEVILNPERIVPDVPTNLPPAFRAVA
jgi:hypothetical protein